MHHVVFVLRSVDPVEPRIERDDGSGRPAPAPEGPHVERGEGLTQWFTLGHGSIEAHYIFDHAYATAHPEALDRAHLEMLHALITFKLFDDGEILVPPKQLAGVLRWPGMNERRRPLVSSEI